MKIALGMSGGVDSATAAFLLQQQGHEVFGVTLHMTDAAPPDIDGAKNTAARLGIPYEVIDCRKQFSERIEAYFAASYAVGETPNPCVFCNRQVKLAALDEYRIRNGLDAIATGHYARIGNDEQGNVTLLRAADLQKDQSYMLYRITMEQLSHLILPLGGLTKPQIRAIAAEQSLLPVIPRDSMDICFIPDGDYGAYLRKAHHMEPVNGAFLNQNGDVIGTHHGQWLYTVGQRKGLGLARGTPVYVLSKHAENNTVTVGEKSKLFASVCRLRECNWLSKTPNSFRGTAKVRYSRTEAAVTVRIEFNDDAMLIFDTPQRAMTCGQSAVLYEGDRVLGGGVIAQVDYGEIV